MPKGGRGDGEKKPKNGEIRYPNHPSKCPYILRGTCPPPPRRFANAVRKRTR